MKKLFVLFFCTAFFATSGLVMADGNDTRDSSSSLITLQAQDGTFSISPTSNKLKSVTVPMVGYKRFIEYSTDLKQTRVKDRFPTLVFTNNGDPRDDWWLVKLIYWKDADTLVLDIVSPSVWQGEATSNDPDDSCKVPYTAKNIKARQWQITPKKELTPGEYGLFRWVKSYRSELYRFMVEEDTVSPPPAPSTASTADNASLYSNVKGILLNNGKFIEGTIISIENDMVKIRTKNNKISSYHFIKEVKKFVNK